MHSAAVQVATCQAFHRREFCRNRHISADVYRVRGLGTAPYLSPALRQARNLSVVCRAQRKKVQKPGADKRNGDLSTARVVPNTRTAVDGNTLDKQGSWLAKAAKLLEPLLQTVARRFNSSFSSWDDLSGKLLYNYYNWRQDTGSDLLLFIGFNLFLMVLGGTIKHMFVDGGREQFWLDLYEVITLTFGQEFPDIDETFAQQAYAVFIAAFGLAAFALVLALVEQLVLEVLDDNVRRGSQVYEEGHVLILGWCDSRRDLELVGKVVHQLCYAYRTTGGTTVVVLTRQEKLVMEGIFKRSIPMHERFGTKLVFRQGNPLVPLDLQMVAASKAACTIIISDQSRNPDEADAQSLRCAILIDELSRETSLEESDKGVTEAAAVAVLPEDGTDTTATGSIAAEILDLPPAARPFTQVTKSSTRNSPSTSTPGSPAKTNPWWPPLDPQSNKVTLVGQPRQRGGPYSSLSSLTSSAMGSYDQDMVRVENGTPTPTESKFSPDSKPSGPAVGFMPWWARSNNSTDSSSGNGNGNGKATGPTNRDGSEAIMRAPAPRMDGFPPAGGMMANLRSTDGMGLAASQASMDLASGDAMSGALSSVDAATTDSLGSVDNLPWKRRNRIVVVEMKTMNMTPLVRYSCNPNVIPLPTGQINARRLATMVKTPHFAVTSQHLFSFENESQVYMQQFPELVGTRFGDAVFRFPEGTVFGVCNPSSKMLTINAKANYIMKEDDQLIIVRPTNVAPEDYKPLEEPVKVSLGDWHPYSLTPTASKRTSSAAGKMGAYSGRTASITFAAGPFGGLDLSMAESMLSSGTTYESDSESEPSQPPAPKYVHKPNWQLVPTEYLQVDTKPVRLLVCGWAEMSFMVDLLLEMDTGQSKLPPGSQVVFANNHLCSQTVDKLLRSYELKNLTIYHCQLDPLHRSELASHLDITTFTTAMVLCDQQWLDTDMDNSNGYDILEENDMLRLDSLIMAVQLNIRKLLEQMKRPAINIICQKVAMEGLTMFEDRNRLPLGISVNMTSFAAKIITNVAYNPQILLPISKLYDDVELTMVDASEYARQGEELSFWEVMRRAQEKEHILLGYYAIPPNVNHALQTTINPMGMEARSRKRVWNNQSGQLKFIIYRNKDTYSRVDSLRSSGEEDFYINSDPATWVAWSADPTLSPVLTSPKVVSNGNKGNGNKQ